MNGAIKQLRRLEDRGVELEDLEGGTLGFLWVDFCDELLNNGHHKSEFVTSEHLAGAFLLKEF